MWDLHILSIWNFRCGYAGEQRAMCVAKFCLDICYCYSNAELCDASVWSVDQWSSTPSRDPSNLQQICNLTILLFILHQYRSQTNFRGWLLPHRESFYPVAAACVCLAQYLHWRPCLHPIRLGSAISLNLQPQYQYFRCRKSLPWNLTTCLYSEPILHSSAAWAEL